MPKSEPTASALAGEYARLWDALRITPAMRGTVEWYAERVVRHRARYEAVAADTGIPWWFIGLIHGMECGFSFEQHLHNGDSLTRRTVRVPAGRPTTGRGPFTWEVSARDALAMKGYIGASDWSVEMVAWRLERYNGWGYRRYHPETLSPYLWSGSQHYTAGKYVSDGKWSATAISRQAGAMVILRAVADRLPEVRTALGRAAAPTGAEPEPKHERPGRAEPLTPPDLARGSRKWRLLDLMKWIFGGSGVSVLGFLSADQVTGASATITAVKQAVAEHGLLLLGVGLLACYALPWLVQRYMIEDAAEGRYTPSGGAQ